MRFARNGRTLLILAFASWAAMVFSPFAFAQTGDSIAPLPPRCRLVLLPLPEPIHDARLLDALAQLRGGKRRGEAAPKSSRANDRFAKLQKGKPTVKPPAAPLLTPGELRIIARVLFRETLAARLQTTLKVALVPDDTAQNTLRDFSAEDWTPTTAGKLTAQLNADAALVIDEAHLTLPDSETKRTILRVRLRLFAPQTSAVRSNAEAVSTERDFWTASVAARPAAPFGKRTSRIGALGTGRAARQAAFRAAHTLKTGEILPLCLPNIRFALAPVPAPSSADQMLFASSGRIVRTRAARDLPTEVSGLFMPDLAPLPDAAILPQYKMRKALAGQGLPITALWTREDEPQIERARSAARKIGADYVLMATVSDLDVDAGLEADAKTMTWLAEGRAEAVGALLRVSDGAILWRDRAAVTLPSRMDRSRSFSTLRQEQTVARDAAKFALLDLQRRFHRYIARFEN